LVSEGAAQQQKFVQDLMEASRGGRREVSDDDRPQRRMELYMAHGMTEKEASIAARGR
jgi:hypothetical protein